MCEQKPQKEQAAIPGAKRIEAVRREGFWFIDIPRTSSSSIKAELGHRFGAAYGKTNLIEKQHAIPQLFSDHLTAMRMREILGAPLWENLYTFTFVRNPFDRVLSLYRYLERVNEIPDDWSFDRFLNELVQADSKTDYFEYYAKRYRAVDFLLDADDRFLVKDIFRFEEREQAIIKLKERLPILELGRLHLQKASPDNKSYRQFYTTKTKKMVEQFFAKDFEVLGYNF